MRTREYVQRVLLRSAKHFIWLCDYLNDLLDRAEGKNEQLYAALLDYAQALNNAYYLYLHVCKMVGGDHLVDRVTSSDINE